MNLARYVVHVEGVMVARFAHFAFRRWCAGTVYIGALGMAATMFVAPVNASHPASHAMPSPFLGRWTPYVENCVHTDAEGDVTISGTTIKYYEARATIQSVQVRGGDTAIVRAKRAFPGQRYRPIRLTLKISAYQNMMEYREDGDAKPTVLHSCKRK